MAAGAVAQVIKDKHAACAADLLRAILRRRIDVTATVRAVLFWGSGSVVPKKSY